MISKLIDLLVIHPKKFLFTALGITLLLAFFVPEIRMVTSVEQLYPSKKDPDRQVLEETEYLFGEDPSLIVALKTDEVFKKDVLTKVRALTRDIEKVEHVTRVDSLATAKRIISDEESMLAEDFLEKIPQTENEIKALRKEYFDNPLYRNAYVSANGQWAIFNVVLESEDKIGNIPPIVKKIRALAVQYQGPERIFVSGRSELNTSFNDLMQSDRRRLIPILIVVMLIVLYLNFRSLVGFALPLVSVLIGVVWTFGVMSLFGIPISILTSTLPSILIAIGCSYAIYFLATYFTLWSEDQDPVDHLKRVLNKTLLAVIFCAFTTIVGFFGLSLNDINLIKQMGVAAVIGISSLLALTAFVLPCFILVISALQQSRLRRQRPIRIADKKQQLHTFPRRFLNHSGKLLCGWAIVFMICLFFIPQLKIENDPSTFFKKDSSTWTNLQSLVNELNMYGRFKIVLSAKQEDYFKNPEALKQIELLGTKIQALEETGKTMSLADFVKTINKSFNEHKPEFEAIPPTEQEVAQYLLLYSLSGDDENLYRYVTEDYKTTQIDINAGVTSSIDSLTLANKIEADCNEVFGDDVTCRASGASLILAKSARYIALGVLKGFSLALFIILILMFVLFRSIRIGLIAMIPNVVPTSLLLSFMAIAGIPLNVGTSIILTIALGIAVDDTLHFFVHYYQELKQTNHFLIQSQTGIRITEDQKWAVVTTWRHLYKALTTTTATIVCGFLVLTLSDLTPLALFGSLTALTMFFALLTDLTLTPALIMKTKF